MKKITLIFKQILTLCGANYLILLSDFFIRAKVDPKSKTLLIVRLDAIGDYILFRNFLETIHKSKKFYDYEITLCGNEAWKEIALKFDQKYVDKFIWIKRAKFLTNLQYRHQILNQIAHQGFGVAIQPNYSRELLFGDAVVRASGAVERIGSQSDLTNSNRLQRAVGDKFYTKLLSTKTGTKFEFWRNKDFIEKLLSEKVQKVKPDFGIISRKRENLAVIMPGGSSAAKRWAPEKFAEIASYLYHRKQQKIVIAGGKEDIAAAEIIKKLASTAQIENVAGKISFVNFIDLVAKSSLVVSNETSAVHVGVATNTPTCCISWGFNLGRFDPYPKNIYTDLGYIYPPSKDAKIQEVNVEKVKEMIEVLWQRKN